MDDFLKTELRVAEILTAEKIEKSEKLIKLTVSLGEEIIEQLSVVLLSTINRKNLSASM